MSDTCSLFPPFGDPSPSCRLPSQSLGWEDPLEKECQPTPIFLPGNPTDRGAWQARDQRVTKSQRQLSNKRTQIAFIINNHILVE